MSYYQCEKCEVYPFTFDEMDFDFGIVCENCATQLLFSEIGI